MILNNVYVPDRDCVFSNASMILILLSSKNTDSQLKTAASSYVVFKIKVMIPHTFDLPSDNNKRRSTLGSLLPTKKSKKLANSRVVFCEANESVTRRSAVLKYTQCRVPGSL